MPLLRNLLSHKDKSSDFSKTEQNPDHLNQCTGCKNVERLIRQNVERQRNGLERIPNAILHNSFEELNNCAYKCEICRVFRQALILAEVTFDGVDILQGTPCKVIVGWEETVATDGALRFSLQVRLEGQSRLAGVVNCNSRNNVTHLALCPNGLEPAVIEQAKEWLDTCLKTHTGHCDNLRWSRENPKLLIEIMSPTLGRLCENQSCEYVALSYCWGTQTLSEAESKKVDQGKTVLANLEQRRQSFSISELPATVRDALHIIHAIGYRYAWIDSLCIVQDKLDSHGKPEGTGTMHLVYSNALFTLCASATTRATAPLLDKRKAWTWRTEPCRLGEQWLTTPDMSLTELRLKSPLSARAWTLQEERLSPRMLYFSSNRVYWSCAKGHEMEMRPTYGRKATPLQRPCYAPSNHKDEMPLAQEFLLACYSDTSTIHSYWAEIVKSYAVRDMSFSSDRLTALSGLAAKYLSASKGDEYLAGLWTDHLAEGLAWRVKKTVKTDRNKLGCMAVTSSWPSWSWAVTPPSTAIETKASIARSPLFERVIDTVGSRNGVDDPIKYGEQVKEIRVTGRTRTMWTPSSLRIDWSTVSRIREGEERFTFTANPEQDMHAVQPESGRVLVYEERRKEVVGQLDFQEDVEKLQSAQMEVKALELGASTMLLLCYSSGGKWRRVGVAWDVRKDYFASAQRETLTLR